MKTPLKFSIAASPLIVSCFAALGHAAFSAPKEVKIGFAASGPAGLKIEGSTKELTVTEADGNVVVDVPLASLATGIALRDQHMKDKYLEVSKYPLATLTVARSANVIVHVPAIRVYSSGCMFDVEVVCRQGQRPSGEDVYQLVTEHPRTQYV